MTSNVSIPLSELLLRPSTLQRFTKRGFETTDEIEESRANGGINLLASELDVSLQEAAGLIREVQGCLGFYEQSKGIGFGGDDRKFRRSAQAEIKNGVLFSKTSEDDPDHIEHNNDETDINAHAPGHCDDGIVTAYELLMHGHRRSIFGNSIVEKNAGNDHNRRHIVTFCRSIDDLLGGGISIGQVTEIAGLPGTGKTQLGIQLSVLARLPHKYGGVEGRTLYIDTEGSFLAERAWSMAEALYNHVHGRKLQHRRGSKQELPNDFTTEEILDSIDVFRVHDETALLATLYSLQHHILSSPSSQNSNLLDPKSSLPVKLIVIDSIAFHFRAVIPDNSSYYVQRTKTLTSLAAYLGDLAHRHDLAVVVTNHMTTKIGNNGDSSNHAVSVVPALGESWAHATATRLLLSKEERYLLERAAPSGDRDGNNDVNDDNGTHHLWTCSLTKSANLPNGTASYRIVEGGIRDIADKSEIPRNRNAVAGHGNNKRSRTN